MIPGKQYSPEQVLATVWNRRWILMGGLVLGAVVAYGVSRVMPTWYKSEAVILVVPQRVPDNYVRSTVTAKIEDRVKTISQEILGQAWLQRTIEEFDLYSDLRRERGGRGMEDAINRMRIYDVKVQFVKTDAFAVSYRAADPKLAQRVVARLASDFVELNLRDRRQVAEDTTDLLEGERKEKERQLVESERRLEAYRRQHAGELPTQMGANQQFLQNTQAQVQSLVDQMNQLRDRRLINQRELADLAAIPAEAAADRLLTAITPLTPGDTLAAKVAEAEAALREVLTRYKDGHPDVSAARRRVRDLQNKYSAQQPTKTAATGEPAPAPVSAAERAQQNRIRQLRNDIDNIDRQIAAKQAEEQRLRGVMAEFQRRIDAAPTRETELVALTRDYETLKQMYVSLVARKEDAKLASRVETGQVGQQFKILDPPRVPSLPYSPNIPNFVAIGAAGGLLLASLLVGWLEYRDGTLKTEEDVLSCVGLPVIAVIPVMTRAITPTSASRLKRLLPWGGTAAVVLATSVRTWLG